MINAENGKSPSADSRFVEAETRFGVTWKWATVPLSI